MNPINIALVMLGLFKASFVFVVVEAGTHHGHNHHNQYHEVHLEAPNFSATPAVEAVPIVPHDVKAAVDANNAREASETAKNSAAIAKELARQSVDIASRMHSALKDAHDVIHAARVDSQSLSPAQDESLRAAEAKLKSARSLDSNHTTAANDEVAQAQASELKSMQDELKALQQKLDSCSQHGDESVEQMDRELAELQEMLRRLEQQEANAPATNRASHGKLEIEIQHLRDAIARLERFGGLTATVPKSREVIPETGELRYRVKLATPAPRVQLTPLVALDVSRQNHHDLHKVPPPQPTSGASNEAGRFDYDTEMPYGDLEPFGREDTAQELTEASIRESDKMVDQMERAEVAEEKRAVFRALTRLRGAAITSFDGIARSQTGNVDEYSKIHQWRSTHPLQHLADVESDVAKWAFPQDADF